MLLYGFLALIERKAIEKVVNRRMFLSRLKQGHEVLHPNSIYSVSYVASEYVQSGTKITLSPAQLSFGGLKYSCSTIFSNMQNQQFMNK